jgi:hypothetical protein
MSLPKQLSQLLLARNGRPSGSGNFRSTAALADLAALPEIQTIKVKTAETRSFQPVLRPAGANAQSSIGRSGDYQCV